MYCKICTKAKSKSNGSPRQKFSKYCALSVLLVFKNAKWPTCFYMLFVSVHMGHMFMDLGLTLLGLGLLFYWLCESRTHYSFF